MEPISVIASITGVLLGAAQITKVVSEFIEKEKDAPKSAQSVVLELSDLSLCLRQLAPFIKGTRRAERSRQECISIEHVIILSTSLALNISELEELIDALKLRQPISRFAKIRWVKNEGKINRLLSRLRATKSSLNLVLTIFTCISTETAQTSAHDLTRAVERVLQISEDVSQRMASMEMQFGTNSGYAASTIQESLIDDNMSMFPHGTWADQAVEISGIDGKNKHDVSASSNSLLSLSTPNQRVQIASGDLHRDTGLGQHMLQLHPTTESELYTSRVYKRTEHRHSMSSLFSGHDSAAGLSFLSKISLAQISLISVVSLPVCCNELWNSQQYRDFKNPSIDDIIPGKFQSSSATWSTSDRQFSERQGGVLDTRVGHGENGLIGVALTSYFKRRPPIKVSAGSDRETSLLLDETGELQRQTKVALGGIALSGKTTLMRQMRLIYSEGFLIEERHEFRRRILSNLLVGFVITLETVIEWSFENRENFKWYFERGRFVFDTRQYLLDVLQKSPNSEFGVDPDSVQTLLATIQAAYSDDRIQETIRKGNEYCLHDNFQYYMDRVNQILSLDYVPSDKDILHMSQATIDPTFSDFEVDNRRYEVVDVGGRRSLRKQWVQDFNRCHHLVFVASLSGYDECLIEDGTANQTQESLLLFESILILRGFEKFAITLLLTKMDLFEHKVKNKPIRDHFPDYSGPSNDIESGRDFFVHKYLSLNRLPGRKIDVLCANVTDTTSFEPRLRKIMRIAAESSDMEVPIGSAY